MLDFLQAVETSLAYAASLGPEMLWATDYPHPDGFFGIQRVAENSAEHRRKVLAEGLSSSTNSPDLKSKLIKWRPLESMKWSCGGKGAVAMFPYRTIY